MTVLTSVATLLIVLCSALVSAFEKAKKKYIVKMNKMETQMQLMTERHESQVVLFLSHFGLPVRDFKHRVSCRIIGII